MSLIVYPTNKKPVKYFSNDDVFISADQLSVQQYCTENNLSIDHVIIEAARFSNDGGILYQYYDGSKWVTEYGFQVIIKSIVLNELPFLNDALFWLDGTIVNIGGSYYFKDKKNNRNFLITDYDFNEDWTLGFPYKTVATISAPAGDTELINADVNNFLYNSGGTPNQIPVISLFQDIDYEHKLFNRHLQQVLDSNSVEVFEARVLDITLYKNIKTDADLTKCQSYFNVPIEDLNAYWIDPINGNDNNDGTKISPWKTCLSVGVKTLTSGKNIYIKSGTEVLADTWVCVKGNNWIAIGNFTLKSENTTSICTIINENTTFSGFNLTTESVVYRGFNLTSCHSIYRCRIMNVSYGVLTENSNLIISNCVFKNISISSVIDITNSSVSNLTVDSCISDAINKRLYYSYYGINVGDLNIRHCKTKSYLDIYGSYTNININNNSLSSITLQQGEYTGIININDNVFTLTDNQTVIGASGLQRYIFSILRNKFLCGNYNSTPIGLTNQYAPVIKHNLIYYAGYTNGGTGINLNSTGVNCGAANITGNKYINPSPLSYPGLSLGNEDDGLSDNAYEGSIVEDNYFIFSKVFSNTENTIHGFFITRNKNCKVNRNRIEGADIGIVFKSSGFDNSLSECSYNIIIDCQTPLMSKGCNGTKFYNNTVITNSDKWQQYGFMIFGNGENGSKYCELKNNIIIDLSNSGVGQLLNYYVDNASIEGFVSDYNILYSKHNNLAQIGTTIYSTISQLKSSGYDEHSVQITNINDINVIFNDINIKDFSLKPGSLAIGIGTNLGTEYSTGLSSTTNWGNDDELPVVELKEQGQQWNVGAYV